MHLTEDLKKLIPTEALKIESSFLEGSTQLPIRHQKTMKDGESQRKKAKDNENLAKDG